MGLFVSSSQQGEAEKERWAGKGRAGANPAPGAWRARSGAAEGAAAARRTPGDAYGGARPETGACQLEGRRCFVQKVAKAGRSVEGGESRG